MEDRNVQLFTQALFNKEALGGFDVLKIDSAKARPKVFHGFDHFVHILGVDFDIEAVYIGETLEQDGFSFHHRLRGQRSDIA